MSIADIQRGPGEKPRWVQAYALAPVCGRCVQGASGSTEQPENQKSVGNPPSNGVISSRSQPPPGKPECRVGQYVVDLASFEQLALPVLKNVSTGAHWLMRVVGLWPLEHRCLLSLLSGVSHGLTTLLAIGPG